MTKARRKTKKVKRQPLTDEQKAQRKQKTSIRSLLTNAGFLMLKDIALTEFEFKGRKSDFDDVFIYENIILFLEYTVVKDIASHLFKKKVIYDHIIDHQEDFLEFLDTDFPGFKKAKGTYYTNHEFKIFIIYCAKTEVNDDHKKQVPKIKFFDPFVVEYFKNLAGIIKTSARFELFKFLGLKYADIGNNISPTSGGVLYYKGSLLPESYSNFSKGYKVVSFYIDPKSLIEKSYVLRKYGWEDEQSLYQRMIKVTKIRRIREYLNREERVFINNIIITLPVTTQLLDQDKNTIKFNTVSRTQPVEIQVPNEFNIIGLIDGQHRVFAYHEGGKYEDKIKKLREKQNLLVTGIVYPAGITAKERVKFEARLFLEINSTQTNAKSDLTQAIGLILRPFALESISRAVLEKLNKKSALASMFELNPFDKGKIKTTSIVSYGIGPLVKLSGADSLFKKWKNVNKENLKLLEDEDLLNEYLEFCTAEIKKFLLAAMQNLPAAWYIANKNNPKAILNTTTINGLLICIRKLIENNKLKGESFYQSKLTHLSSIKFLTYKSSQYADLGEKIYTTCFA